MAGKRDTKGKGGSIIIKKNEIIEGGHHGGAWKVAYADFVTAMMAFFLLMWLLNATTEDQRKGLADYFSPNNLLSHASSGMGQPFAGKSVIAEGALVSDTGAVQVVVGKRPPVEPQEEGDTEVFRTPRGHHGEHVGGKEVENAQAAIGQGATGQAALHMGREPDATALAGQASIAGDQRIDGRRPKAK